MTRFDYYSNINPDAAKKIMKIAKELEDEKQQIIPDEEKMKKLVYRQFMAGMEINTGQGRNYKLY